MSENSKKNSDERLAFLLLMQDYHGVYTAAIESNPDLKLLPFGLCVKELFAEHFYYGDSYIYALSLRGFHAEQIVPMCLPLQHKWAAEEAVWAESPWVSACMVPAYRIGRLNKSIKHWYCRRILDEQIKRLKPRFIWVFSGVRVSHENLLKWRSHSERIFLWWSSPLKPKFPYSYFDLILSGIPSLVQYFQIQGLNAAYLPHAFDHRILQLVPDATKRISKAAFVGTLSHRHTGRIKFLDALSRHIELDFYGYGLDLLPKDSPLRATYHGPVWGKDLYTVYGSYDVVIHKNINMAEKSASAKRLFEATGMGACVVTESDETLEALFRPGHEIISYSSFEECVDKIKYLLNNRHEAIQIGRNGQDRTLMDHTYERRTQQLIEHMKYCKRV